MNKFTNNNPNQKIALNFKGLIQYSPRLDQSL